MQTKRAVRSGRKIAVTRCHTVFVLHVRRHKNSPALSKRVFAKPTTQTLAKLLRVHYLVKSVFGGGSFYCLLCFPEDKETDNEQGTNDYKSRFFHFLNFSIKSCLWVIKYHEATRVREIVARIEDTRTTIPLVKNCAPIGTTNAASTAKHPAL